MPLVLADVRKAASEVTDDQPAPHVGTGPSTTETAAERASSPMRPTPERMCPWMTYATLGIINLLVPPKRTEAWSASPTVKTLRPKVKLIEPGRDPETKALLVGRPSLPARFARPKNHTRPPGMIFARTVFARTILCSYNCLLVQFFARTAFCSYRFVAPTSGQKNHL